MKSRLFPLEQLLDLIQLREIIYVDQNADRANEIIEAIQLRGKAPLSVELTLLTMMAQKCPTTSACSLAIVRFINNLLDAQQDTVHAIPLSALCHQLNIPSFWVDIRHQITHQSMPSLSLMQSIVGQMHQYLYSEFWTLLDTPSNDKFLWSKDIILKFLKQDAFTTMQQLKKLKCSDFYDHVADLLPNVLLSDDWISDYVGYLLVEIAVDSAVPIHSELEVAFTKAMVFFCISKNVQFPAKYQQILRKHKEQVIRIGLLTPYTNEDVLQQLEAYGCADSVRRERILYGGDLKVPRQPKPKFNIGISGSHGDIENQSWLVNGEVRYVDAVFKNTDNAELVEVNPAFSVLKESLLAQFN